VNKILVPLDSHHSLQLRAAYFALEFAKRTGAKVLFLDIQRSSDDEGPDSPSPARDEELGEDLHRLINSSLMEGLQIETYVTNGDYVERVIEFADHHNVSRVILALPEAGETGAPKAASTVEALQERLSCGLVTVRPRYDTHGTRSRAS
jgi:nucleotide-binding universal stress UspA family protein